MTLSIQPTVKVFATNEDAEEIKNNLVKRLDATKIPYEISQKEVHLTEFSVSFKLSTFKVIKKLFNLVKAPENEIKYLANIASIVKATAEDTLKSLVNGVFADVTNRKNNK